MVDALSRPEKAQYHTVEFRGEDPSLPFGLTNWDTPIDTGAVVFTSYPAMGLDIPPNRGTFGEDLCKIKLKIDSVTEAMLDPMTRGTPFAKTIVIVKEIIEPARIGDSGSTRVVFRGQVFRTRRNVDGKRDLCLVECKNQKALLGTKLGFQVNANCVWRLYGTGCREVGSHGPSGYTWWNPAITIDGKKVIVNDAALVLDLAGTRTWTRGYLKKNGATIGIQYYDKSQDGSVTKEFILVKQPPIEWETGTVTFYPGCTKQIDGDGGCRSAWNNEEGFGGSGYAIPSYNPIMENPA
jgi:hypothetical protein